jgi:hypothetical protein
MTEIYKIRNTLEMHLIEDKVKEDRIKWPEQRMDDTRIPEKTFYYTSR